MILAVTEEIVIANVKQCIWGKFSMWGICGCCIFDRLEWELEVADWGCSTCILVREGSWETLQ